MGQPVGVSNSGVLPLLQLAGFRNVKFSAEWRQPNARGYGTLRPSIGIEFHALAIPAIMS